jgi:hypothetical protein
MKRSGFKKIADGPTKIFESEKNKKERTDFQEFNYEDFIKFYRGRISQMPDEDSPEMMTLLPLAANMKSRILAHSKSLGYTEKL